MCEILIRVQDKVPFTHPMRRHNTERGDIVTVLPDGTHWGECLINPQWRIVRLSGLPVESLTDLLTPSTNRDGRLLSKRSRGIDLDSIPELEKNLIQGRVIELLPIEVQKFLAARKNKTSRIVEIG